MIALRPALTGAAAIAAVLLWAALAADGYEQRVLTLAGVYALLVIGYQQIFGHIGALSLAQGTFFGIGAYATAILSTRLGWEAQLTLPLSVLAPMAVAALIGVPVLRLASHYFALATLGIGQVVLLIVVNWQDATGGANGIPGVPGLVLFGEAVPRGLPLLLAVWLAVAIGALIALRMTSGAAGLALRTLRATPLAAAALGIDGGLWRYRMFLASSAFAGAAGALHAHTARVVSPEVLEFPVMIACLAMTVLGGATSVAGGILAALLLVHLPEWFRGLEHVYLMAYGAGLLALIIVAPEGLAGLLARLPITRPARGEPPAAPPKAAERPGANAKGGAPLLAIADARKRFGGIAAVDGVSLTVSRGEIVGLIGPNGSGKTTLLNLVSGFEAADAGTVVLNGETISGLAPDAVARRGLARSFQTVELVEDMTALDAVATARALARRNREATAAFPHRRAAELATARAEARVLLMQCGLGAVAASRCGDLPFGVRRHLDVTRALAGDPLLLALDEPASGLDAADRASLAARLRALAEGGLGVLIVEHAMSFLMPLAHRIVCLDRGRVVADAAPEAIRNDPRVIAVYLGRSAA